MTVNEESGGEFLRTATFTYAPESTSTASVRNGTDVAPLSDLIGVAVALCGSVGVLANVAVMLVLVLSRSATQFSSYRYLIVHLAACDLLSSVFQLLYAPLELQRHHWIYAEWSCKLIYPMMTVSTNLATGTILVIAAERYQGVFWPHHSRWKKRTIALALGAVWMTSVLVCIPNCIQLVILEVRAKKYCVELWGRHQTLQQAYGISFFFLVFFIPLVAISFMHARIICKIRHPEVRPDRVSRSQRRDEMRIASVLTAIVVAFAVCTSPNKLLYFVYDVAPSVWNADVHFYMRLMQLPYYARAMVDPLLYCAVDKRFKRDLSNAVQAVQGASFLDSLDLRSRTFTGNGRSLHGSPRSSPRSIRTMTRSSSKISMSRDLSVDSLHNVGGGATENRRMHCASEELILAAARNRWERSVSCSPIDKPRSPTLLNEDKSSGKSLSRRVKMYSTSDLPESHAGDAAVSNWSLIRASMKCARSITNYDDDVFCQDRDDCEKQSFCNGYVEPAKTTEI